MNLTRKQFAKIEHLMLKQRKKSTISNYDFVCAMLYIIENGCKWRALPKEFGNWHTIYVRFNRWSKNGTIDRIFEELQNKNIKVSGSYDSYGQSSAIRGEYFYRCEQTKKPYGDEVELEKNCCYYYDKATNKYKLISADGSDRSDIEKSFNYFDEDYYNSVITELNSGSK